MRFSVEQRFAYPIAGVEQGLLDPDFIDSLGDLDKVAPPELLEHEIEGPLVRRRVRYRFTGQLSAAVTSVVDPDRLVWVEESTHDLTDHTGQFSILPEAYANRLRCSGTWQIQATGEGATRTVEGELTVSFPLVGGRVERAIVSGLVEHLDREAAALERWLAAHP